MTVYPSFGGMTAPQVAKMGSNAVAALGETYNCMLNSAPEQDENEAIDRRP